MLSPSVVSQRAPRPPSTARDALQADGSAPAALTKHGGLGGARVLRPPCASHRAWTQRGGAAKPKPTRTTSTGTMQFHDGRHYVF
ncbi:hypothetical protein T492DRAFT_940118 [Pavlovales sp. CCMP2436]|nr:hypothetical protein T492DRAFT_940118 [Pavlovales sp. CCMP2436]